MDDKVDYDFFDDEQSPKQDKIKLQPSSSNTVEADILAHPLTTSSSESSQDSSDELHGTSGNASAAKSPTSLRSSSRVSTTSSKNRSNTNGSETSDDQLNKSHNSTYVVKHVSSHKKGKKKARAKSYSKSKPVSNKIHSSDSDVTDVSPLTSPPNSPVFHHRNEPAFPKKNKPPANMRHITKLNVVFRDSSSGDGLNEPHQRHSSRAETADTQQQRRVHDDHWSSSSDENEREQYDKKKSTKKDLKMRRDMAVRNHRKRLLDSSARESMEICNLLETVLEFEKKKQDAKEIQYRRRFDGEFSSRSQRKNMSFSNDQVRNIDHENQRLLREITKMNSRRSRPSSASSMRSVSTVKSNASTQSRTSTSSRSSRYSVSRKRDDRPTKLYHSAINRVNYQQQIERENMQLLKRLQAAKPTQGMRRRAQLEDYKQQTKYMGGTIDRNNMSVQRAHELTRNADVVRDAIGLSRQHHGKPVWQDSW
uniref:Cilia- and flagella-associated protein 97 n=1 Tax=Phallusia mammillata TaxID=59560 RepID=A0A6F9DGM4_9ASCI|nr:UPF0501 protein KIAA1430 [Phallusia mammillata]